jgi:hypothetical protein
MTSSKPKADAFLSTRVAKTLLPILLATACLCLGWFCLIGYQSISAYAAISDVDKTKTDASAKPPDVAPPLSQAEIDKQIQTAVDTYNLPAGIEVSRK